MLSSCARLCSVQFPPKTRREKFFAAVKLGFGTAPTGFLSLRNLRVSDSIIMATSSSPSRPSKRRRENQDEIELEEPKDSTATATTVQRSPNGTETEGKKMSPVVVFAHGAGAPSSSDWMIRSSSSLNIQVFACKCV